uniref:Uncharacterized protein n=1 Tax=mine drainage metagenome TaxID=410659 RepID=E6QU86_9ZZZZ
MPCDYFLQILKNDRMSRLNYRPYSPLAVIVLIKARAFALVHDVHNFFCAPDTFTIRCFAVVVLCGNEHSKNYCEK